MTKNFFKKRGVTAAFSVFALISGFAFLNQGLTGNAISQNQNIGSFNIVSFIGLLLVFCSAVLAFYSARNR